MRGRAAPGLEELREAHVVAELRELLQNGLDLRPEAIGVAQLTANEMPVRVSNIEAGAPAGGPGGRAMERAAGCRLS